MKKIIVLYIFIQSLSCFSQKILELDSNFNFSSNSLLKDIDISNPEIGEWEVFYNGFSLNSSLNTLTLDIPSGETLFFIKTTSFQNNDIIYWEGNNSGNTIKIEESNGELSGFIKLANGNYYGISYIGNNYYVIFNKGESDSDCDTHLYSFSDTNEEESNTASKASLVSCNGIYTYRIVIAYTPELAANYSNDQDRINNYLIAVIDSINEVYVNSNLDVRARLAFSYETDSEFVGKDANFDAFVHEGYYWPKYDEIFDYVDEYNADVAILLVNQNIGGRASRDKNMGIYGRLGAGTNFGVAHEIGHMFDLDHNREEFNWWQREVNGFDWALDNKKAYGFRGNNYRTVMSYENNNQRRVHFHADEDLIFPDNQAAGNNYAKARDFLQSHKGNVIKNNDANSINLDNKSIDNDQMASYYAYNFLETTNLIVNNTARANLRSGFSVNLKPGTHFTSGSQINVQISDCLTSVGFKTDGNNISETKSNINNEEKIKSNDEFITVYPNPTSGKITISTNEKITNYKIVNSLGNTLLEKEINDYEAFVDIQSLPPGIYIIRIALASGKNVIKKIIKK